MENHPVFITPDAVAEMLGVPTSWVYEKTRSRQRDALPVLRLGRYIRFEKDAVIEWARAHGNKPKKKGKVLQ